MPNNQKITHTVKISPTKKTYPTNKTSPPKKTSPSQRKTSRPVKTSKPSKTSKGKKSPTVADIKVQLQKAGIPFSSRAKKADLLEALNFTSPRQEVTHRYKVRREIPKDGTSAVFKWDLIS